MRVVAALQASVVNSGLLLVRLLKFSPRTIGFFVSWTSLVRRNLADNFDLGIRLSNTCFIFWNLDPAVVRDSAKVSLTEVFKAPLKVDFDGIPSPNLLDLEVAEVALGASDADWGF